MINLTIDAQHVEHLHEQLKGILYGLAQQPSDLALQAATFVNAGNIARVEAKVDGALVNGAAQLGSPSLAESTKNLPKMTKKQEAALKAAVEQKAEEPASPAEGMLSMRVGVEPESDPLPAGVPTLDDLRASLMSLSKAEGHGSDAVFALLEKFGAKNASTVPEDKRAAVIAAVATKLEG